MGTMGKVLAVLNVLAAIGFLIMASLDYGTRQVWTYANQQQEFAINGIPVDAQEADTDGIQLVDLMSPKMQGNLGITGLKTQVDEVQSRKKAALDALASADDAQKKQKALAIALPVARSQAERNAIRLALESKTGEEIITSLCKEAAEGTTESGTTLSPALRRQAIAHLLLTLNDKEQPDYDRVQRVVGMREFARAVESQSHALQTMMPALREQIGRDEATFVSEHRAILLDLIGLREQIENLMIDSQRLDALKEKDQVVVNERTAEKEKLLAEIAASDKAAKEALAEQSRLEKELFGAQRMISARLAENQGKLGAIRSTEQTR